MHIIDLFDQKFAVGLWWQIRPGGPAQKKVMLNLARETSREFSETERFNCVALRAQQYGLGHWEETHPGIYSLAAALRPLGGRDSFLGIFRLQPSLWWVCAISKGIIAAEGDACFANEKDASSAASSLRQLFTGLEEVLCSTPEESASYLGALLRPDAQLQELFPGAASKRKRQIKIGFAICAVAFIIGGFWFYGLHTEKRAMEILLQSQEAASRYKNEIAAHPEKFFPMLWVGAPLPGHAGRQCVEAILQEPLVFKGWSLEEAVCIPGKSLTVIRSHNRGANFLSLPQKTSFASAEVTTEVIPLPPLPARPSLPPSSLLSRRDISAVLFQATQDVNAKLDSLSWVPPEQLRKNDIQLVAPWQTGRFILSEIPSALLRELAIFNRINCPGMVINAVNYKNRAWIIQGDTYAKP